MFRQGDSLFQRLHKGDDGSWMTLLHPGSHLVSHSQRGSISNDHDIEGLVRQQTLGLAIRLGRVRYKAVPMQKLHFHIERK
jgi:hypothetical protein